MPDSAPNFSWLDWHFHAEVILAVLLVEGVYLLGVGPLRRRYGWADRVEGGNVAWFTAGMLVIYVSLTSSLHDLAEQFLFSAHMVQHLLLILVAPPMLLAGMPDWLMRPLLRKPKVLSFARYITRPLAAFIIFNFVLGLWHLPVMYDATLQSRTPHVIEHFLFIATAILMWWPVLGRIPELPRATHPIQTLYLFGMSLPMGMIGAAITFSPNILYEWYASVPRVWGLSVIQDQQLGGLIMKIPGGLAFLIIMGVVFFAWFSRDEKGETETGLREFFQEEDASYRVSGHHRNDT